MNRKVDLHLHSYASDGCWSSAQIIENLDRNQVKVFAVTDHDEVSCVPEMEALVKQRKDLTYIKAVEGTVTYQDKEHHILTYFIDEDNRELQALLAYNRNVRERYNEAMMGWLSREYGVISVDDYRDYSYNPFQGGWRAYGYLKDRGVISGLRDYFSVTNAFKYDKRFLEPETYLTKMKALGFITVLAHPPVYGTGDLYEEEHLDYFRRLGLDGIECYSQYLEDQQNARYYVDYCNKNHMLITGGSDCHGGFAGRRIGYPDVDESMIRLAKH